MNQKFEKLKTLLKELFQLDQPDLDFGLYRVMHAKSAEVTQFLERDLLPQVKEAFAQYEPADKAALQGDLDEAIKQARSLGADPESLPKVQELRNQEKNVHTPHGSRIHNPIKHGEAVVISRDGHEEILCE